MEPTKENILPNRPLNLNPNFLRKEDVKSLLDNRPQGMNPARIIESLVKGGYDLEGYNESKQSALQKTNINQKEPAQSGGFFGKAKDVLVKIGDFLGMTPLAKHEALAVAELLSPEARQYIQEHPEEVPSNMKVLGSAIQTGANIGGVLIQAPTALKAAERIGQIALQGGLVSGALGFGKGLEKEKSVTSSIKEGLISGGVGGIISGGIQGAGELYQYLTSSGVSESIANKALGINKKTIQAGRSPAMQTLTEQGVKTKQGYIDSANQIISDTGNKISQELANSDVAVPTKPILEEIKGSIKKYYGQNLSDNEVDAIVNRLPLDALRSNKVLPINTINELREVIDNKYLQNGKWLGTSTSESITSLKTAANTMRNIVKTAVPGTVPYFDSQSSYITLARSLSNELAKPHIMTNVLEIIGATIAGGATGKGINPKSAAEALAYYGLMKGYLSTPVQMSIAKSLQSLAQTESPQIAQYLGKVSQTGIYNLIKELTK